MIIGLTGNMGSGKSLASSLLAAQGAAVIKADNVGHEVLLPGGPAYDRVRELFGDGFLDKDGLLDRSRLGAFVFADASGRRLRQLEGVTHPAIVDEISRRIAVFQAEGRSLIVVEAALFFDTPLEAMVDQIWAVTAPRETLLRRIMARDGCGRQAAEDRLDKQLPPEELARRSQKVLVNDGTPDDLARTVERAVAELREDGQVHSDAAAEKGNHLSV